MRMRNKARRALTIGAPTFIHSLDPCPKGWDYDPMLSHELGELAIETGIFPLYEVEDRVVKYCGQTKELVAGRAQQKNARLPALEARGRRVEETRQAKDARRGPATKAGARIPAQAGSL